MPMRPRARTLSGWGEKVRTRETKPISRAVLTRTRRILWWPRWSPSKLPMATTVPSGKAGRSGSPRSTFMGGLGNKDLGFFQIVHPELLEAGLEEFFLFRLQVPLGPVLE